MKFEDTSVDIALNSNHHDDESADFFNFFSQEPKNNLTKNKDQQWDFFQESNHGLAFKKEESFNDRNNHVEYLNNQDYFYYQQQDVMECENDYKQYNREFLYPNIQINNQFSNWKQESQISQSKGILVDNQSLCNERKISSISWNKLKNYVEISYNYKEQYLIGKKSSQKLACSDSQIETIEPSLNNSDLQSVKNLENSTTEQEEFLNISQNESSQINMTELSLSHHLDQSSSVNFNEQPDYQDQLIASDVFIIKESGSQKIAYLSGSFISSDLIKLLSDKIDDIQNLKSSQQLSDSFACFKNEPNTQKKKQVQEYIFSNTESFQPGQVTCEELFTLETVDGFQFNSQVFFQVFPLRGINNDLQGYVIKHHLFISQEAIQMLKQLRKDKQQKEMQEKAAKEEEDQYSTKIITKEEQIMKDIQNCEKDDKFSKQVKKFLYKFKYISKQKNQKKQKREQDLFPSKTCKYRLIKQ